MQSVDLSRFHTAIFFMDKGRVVRQMRLSEFESILDGYLGLSDMTDTDVTAVLVVMKKSLSIQSLVFFRIYFDDEGRADGSWNIPIEAMALEGAKGPDLGDGPIQLVCRSQTPRASAKSGLWDPDMSPNHNDFLSIRKAVQENTLKFVIEEEQAAKEDDVPVLSTKAVDTPQSKPGATEKRGTEHRQKLARAIWAQRLRIRTLRSAYKEEVKALEREHRLEIQGMRRKMQDRERQSERLQLATEKLKKKLLQRNEEYLSLQAQLSEAATDGASVESVSAENVLLREQLERKERELSRAQEALVQAEEALRQARDQAPDEGTILERIRDGDVFLVAYRPGAGHITLPYGDIGAYFDNPTAYVAGQCGVSEPAYRHWLFHYENPTCRYGEEDGEACGEPLMRISDPSEFKSGRDDRCDQHKVGVSKSA